MCWGFNAYGQVGNGSGGVDASMVLSPSTVSGDVRFSALAAGFDFTCGLTETGEPYCWGANVSGVIGASAVERCGDAVPVSCATTPVAVRRSRTFVEFAAGLDHVCARAGGGQVDCWGSNALGQLEVPPASAELRAPAGKEAYLTIDAGGVMTCGVTLRHRLSCWGTEARGDPVPLVGQAAARSGTRLRVSGDDAVASVTVGAYHACMVTLRGRSYCWGDDGYGALGRGRG